jgi:enolase 1/2/3
MACEIEKVLGRRVWDSRGRPTLEVEMHSKHHVGRCIAPAGASRGSNEAIDLRDGAPAFGGWGVDRALANVNTLIRDALTGLDATDQTGIDRALIELDGTPNKSRLGGNATVATSIASLDLGAATVGQPVWRYLSQGKPVRMPLPQIQILGGGAHAGGRIDVQDLMVVPIGAHSFDEALCWTAEVYRVAGDILDRTNRRAGVADEGGWWPLFESNEEAIQLLARAIEEAGYHFDQIAIALDVAASQFGSNGRYTANLDDCEYSRDEWLEVLIGWVRRYPIVSIEDPFAEDDAEGMHALTAAIGDRVQIVGDDFLVTNAGRIESAAQNHNCNAALLKPNQAGTVTETLAALEAARKAGFGTIVSARSGETEDVAIVHLSIGWNAGQLKVGSFARSERMAKWNEALRVEESLERGKVFAGRSVLPIH